jgi:hypothetical protein
MLPAVAVRELVPCHARIIYAGDETPAGSTVGATTQKLAWRRKLADYSMFRS